MSRFYIACPFFLIAFALSVLCAPVAATDGFAQSSYTGSKEGFVGSTAKKPRPPLADMDEDEFNDTMERQTPALPPVFDTVEPPTAINEDGYAEDTAEDPCAAYLDNYDGYTICQDRMQKIQRLKDGQKARQESYGTRSTIRPSEQRKIDAQKAAEEAAKTDEERAAEKKAAEEAAAAEKAEAEKKEKTRLEEYQERKDEYIRPKRIGE